MTHLHRKARARLRSFAFLAVFLSAISALTLMMGCKSTNETHDPPPPTPGVATTLRVVNAIPDLDRATVWIDGKLFLGDYPYEVASLSVSGYHSKLADSSNITTGTKTIKITADHQGIEFIDSFTIVLGEHRQTLYLMGRASVGGGRTSVNHAVVLDDEKGIQSDTASFVRFVNAIPDIDSIDVYFSSSTTQRPEMRLAYGQSSDYRSLRNSNGLTITIAGDTSKKLTVFPYSLSINGFYSTVCIRGFAQPSGREKSVSTIVLNDLERGTISFHFESYSARFFNASREDDLSLWIQLPQDKPDIRSNIPSANLTMWDVRHGETKGYLNLSSNFSTSRFFAHTNATIPPSDLRFIDSVTINAHTYDRFTIVACESKDQIRESVKRLFVLQDTLSSGTNSSTPVRIVNVDPDAGNSKGISIAKQTFNLPMQGSIVLDLQPGSQSIEFSGSGISRSFTVRVGHPLTVFLLPADTDRDRIAVLED